MIPPERRIKLMADYFCHPLWRNGGVDVGDIDPASLPISEDLQRDLNAWARVFDAILDMDDPANKGGFESPQAVENFVAQGAQLADRLRQELGSDWDVVYRPFGGVSA
jgi:hypothetical protein